MSAKAQRNLNTAAMHSDRQPSETERHRHFSEPSREQGSDDNACVVCFKNVDIYSIGECDHPVCYECSTRMRVLCQQNECPICRKVLDKVIFTEEKLLYAALESKCRPELFNRKYKIGFTSASAQRAFSTLLDHPCPACDTPPYRTFAGLRNHVRREHDLHYCDLCVEHLRIFSVERRSYTYHDLMTHKSRGDADNKSHRGHPLCEYCTKRYLDRDELFRHLRREHYYCHFCDADGCNEFYRDYPALAEHFRKDHFLCEEGKCATEQFVGAFRLEIDYKAHLANVHGKSLNKQQAKQARTLQLEITLGPRGRQTEQTIANVRTRGRNDDSHLEEAARRSMDQQQYAQEQQQQRQYNNQREAGIDAQNEEEFPSLSGTSGGGPSVPLMRPPPPLIMNRGGTAGLARTKENFPALGGGGAGGGGTPQRTASSPQGPAISKVVRKAPTAATGAIARPSPNNNNNLFIHVSNRPAATGGARKSSPVNDFPALPPGGKNKRNGGRRIDEDMPPPTAPLANVAAKHRDLVDDYVSVACPTNFRTIQMVMEKEEKEKKEAEQPPRAPKLTALEFPSLAPSSSGGGGGERTGKPSRAWSKNGGAVAPMSAALAERRQRELENRRAKVAPPPLVAPKTPPAKKAPTPPQQNNKNNNNNDNSSSMAQSDGASKKSKNKKDKAKPTVEKSAANQSNNNNNNENRAVNPKKSATPPTPPSAANNGNGGWNVVRPPPGFAELPSKTAPAPSPPGFHSKVTLSSVAKPPNELTFTSSLGERFAIVESHDYEQPDNAIVRNQKLIGVFKETMKSREALEQFRDISQSFRNGTYAPRPYYEHCQAALANKFDEIFPELLALLPDISKQQALYLVHTQRLKSMTPDQRKAQPKVEVCGICKQVLQLSDIPNHRSIHALKQNFPLLNGRTSSK